MFNIYSASEEYFVREIFWTRAVVVCSQDSAVQGVVAWIINVLLQLHVGGGWRHTRPAS